MKTNEIDKNFKAVAMMRKARNRISAQIKKMTLEQELHWIDSQNLIDPTLKRLQNRAATQKESKVN